MVSGDSGLRITVPAALQALSAYPQIFLHLCGHHDNLNASLATWPASARARVELLHAPDFVPMGDQPSVVLRKDEASSMRIALEALARGQVAAVISAGNAGALMVLGRKYIGMLGESIRPAFCSSFPTAEGSSLLLDLGANVDCTADQLCSFAILGSALYSSLFPSSSPRVALLSNGVEPGKGNSQVKQAARILAEAPGINYLGYVEASALHSGYADVVVCDGFVGNIALKAIEGTAQVARDKLAQLLSSQPDTGGTVEACGRLRADFSAAMNPELHNGAFLLGLDGVVVKAHGHSSVQGFVASIGQALKCEEQDMIARIKKQLVLADFTNG